MDVAKKATLDLESQPNLSPRSGTQVSERSEVKTPAARSVPDYESRRKFERKDLRLDVSLFSDSNLYAGFTENISAGGVFIATHDRLAIGEKVDLTITFPDDKQVKANGIVRWLREYSETSDAPPGMGIQFLSIEGEDTMQEFLGVRSPLFFDDD